MGDSFSENSIMYSKLKLGKERDLQLGEVIVLCLANYLLPNSCCYFLYMLDRCLNFTQVISNLL